MADQGKATAGSVWDVFAILTLMALCIVGILIVSIFANPASAFNPFPPPTLPALIVLPSSTPTPVYMPPTWTPVGNNANSTEKVASKTPLPTATEYVLPTFTPTFTVTPSPTATETLVPTEPPEPPEPTHTPKPKPTIQKIRLKPSISNLSVTGPTATTAGSFSLDVTVSEKAGLKVSGVSVSLLTSKRTTVKWTCKGAGASCPSSGKNFTVSSIKMYAQGSITIHVEGVIPAKTKSGVTFKATVQGPSGTQNQEYPLASTSLTW